MGNMHLILLCVAQMGIAMERMTVSATFCMADPNATCPSVIARSPLILQSVRATDNVIKTAPALVLRIIQDLIVQLHRPVPVTGTARVFCKMFVIVMRRGLETIVN